MENSTDIILIKVNIAGKQMPLNIEKRKEEKVRRAVMRVNETYDIYDSKYYGVLKEDILRMALLHLATQLEDPEIKFNNH